MAIDGFIKDHDSAKYVLDYQLIYHTDSRINLDFYADGITTYLQRLLHWVRPQRPTYGLVILGSAAYHACNLQHQLVSRLPSAVWQQTRSMIRSISVLRSATTTFEKLYKDRLLDACKIESYYQSIVACMSWKSLSDSIEPWRYCRSPKAYTASVASLRAYSHAGAFSRGLARIGTNPNEDALQSFINDYGFLGDFTISEKETEEPAKVRELAKIGTISPIQQGRHGAKGPSEQLAKRLMFYEEHRHYLQMRALRNFRLLFRDLGLDPCLAVMRDLKGRLALC